MSKLICHQEKVNESNIQELIDVCPFDAIENNNGIIEINAGCKMCKICVKKGPKGIMEFFEEAVATLIRVYGRVSESMLITSKGKYIR